MIGRLFTPWRLRVYPRIGLITLTIPFVVLVAAGDGTETLGGILGGDFPAFYNAGRLVGDGAAQQLYDVDALARVHASWSGETEYGLPFLYPPFVAAAFTIPALLPYRAAYVIHSLVMVAAAGLAVRLLRRPLPRVNRWPVEAFLLAANFYPLFRSMFGGQNTALTLLLLVAGYRALDDDRPITAGAVLGLLFFKPQFALPVAGLLLLRNRRALIGMATTAAALWLGGAMMLGPDWVFTWLDGARSQSNDLIPLVPVWNLDVLGMSEELFGHGSTTAYVVAAILITPLVLALMWIWWSPTVPLDLAMAALVCGLLLIPPHVLWYEAGLLILPFAVVANRVGRNAIGSLLGCMIVAYTGLWISDYSAVPQLAVVGFTAGWVGILIQPNRQDRRPGPNPAPSGGSATVRTAAAVDRP